MKQKHIDRLNTACELCNVGVFKEMSLDDDWTGHVTCDNQNCGNRVMRHPTLNQPKPAEKMPDLSPYQWRFYTVNVYAHDERGRTVEHVAGMSVAAYYWGRRVRDYVTFAVLYDMQGDVLGRKFVNIGDTELESIKVACNRAVDELIFDWENTGKPWDK